MKLNLVGWSAVLGMGLVAAAALRLFRVRPLHAVAIGELGILSVLKAVDYWRWRKSPVHTFVDAPEDVVRVLVAEMQATGLSVTYESVPYEEGDVFEWRPAIASRAAHAVKVRAELRHRGL